MARTKARNKTFDILFAKNKNPTFQRDTIYTFEFFRHLIAFTYFQVNLESMLGKVCLRDVFNGQPLRFMGARQRPFFDAELMDIRKSVAEKNILDTIWPFELWHKGLIENRR